jgi:hypothetical protein
MKRIIITLFFIMVTVSSVNAMSVEKPHDFGMPLFGALCQNPQTVPFRTNVTDGPVR